MKLINPNGQLKELIKIHLFKIQIPVYKLVKIEIKMEKFCNDEGDFSQVLKVPKMTVKLKFYNKVSF